MRGGKRFESKPAKLHPFIFHQSAGRVFKWGKLGRVPLGCKFSSGFGKQRGAGIRWPEKQGRGKPRCRTWGRKRPCSAVSGCIYLSTYYLPRLREHLRCIISFTLQMTCDVGSLPAGRWEPGSDPGLPVCRDQGLHCPILHAASAVWTGEHQ